MKKKNLLITGGATRIGKEIAIHFSKKGWNIAIHYFQSQAEAEKLKKIIEENSVKVALIKADLKNIKQVEKIIPFVKRKLGTIDCLINNASLFERDDVLSFTPKSWNDHLNINLLAPAILTKFFAKQTSKEKIFNIINIIDQRVFKLTPHFMSYTLSKSALYTFTKTMAMRLSPNIKVNGIAPGPTIKSKRQTTKHFNKQAKSTLLQKSVGLEDICDTVEFLIKNKSITGEVIPVDSGQNLTWNIKSGKE
ncbi:SDR family oxidoreductase [Pelagibacteraceae bacterium]|nr:SDR family oxidoreductase [Pelagibacteraceae bacterium]